MADPYSTLGVSRGASEADIKKAYRKLAKELHPDTNKGNPKATERFAEVSTAYDLLSDKDKRAQFDRGEIDEHGNPANPFAGFGGQQGGFRGSSGGFQGGFGDAAAADLGVRQAAYLDLADAADAQLSRGGVAEIDDAAMRIGPSIVDTHDSGLARFQQRHPHLHRGPGRDVDRPRDQRAVRPAPPVSAARRPDDGARSDGRARRGR